MQKKYMTFIACMLVAACASFGVPKLDTFNKRMAGAFVTLTEVRKTNLQLGVSGLTSKQDVKNVNDQLDSLRQGLDVARQYEALEQGAGDDKLQLTISALLALQTYVNSKGGGS